MIYTFFDVKWNWNVCCLLHFCWYVSLCVYIPTDFHLWPLALDLPFDGDSLGLIHGLSLHVWPTIDDMKVPMLAMKTHAQMTTQTTNNDGEPHIASNSQVCWDRYINHQIGFSTSDNTNLHQ